MNDDINTEESLNEPNLEETSQSEEDKIEKLESSYNELLEKVNKLKKSNKRHKILLIIISIVIIYMLVNIVYNIHNQNIDGPIIDLIRSFKSDSDDCLGEVGTRTPRNGGGIYKPNIYLYPETTSNIKVSLKVDNMTCIWPNTNNLVNNTYYWDVTAEPDGTIYIDNNEYSYIFWEADADTKYNFNTGFCIKGEDTGEFLRNTLSQIGLTPKEYNEFIVFWLPKMQDNKYNIISFRGLDANDDYNKEFPLYVEDENHNTPKSILRLNMIWKSSDNYIEIEPQVFNSFERNGFTVVEWGGQQVN